MSKQEYIDRFLVASWLYFRMTEKTMHDMDCAEVEEMLEFIDPDSPPLLCPDQHPA